MCRSIVILRTWLGQLWRLVCSSRRRWDKVQHHSLSWNIERLLISKCTVGKSHIMMHGAFFLVKKEKCELISLSPLKQPEEKNISLDLEFLASNPRLILSKDNMSWNITNQKLREFVLWWWASKVDGQHDTWHQRHHWHLDNPGRRLDLLWCVLPSCVILSQEKWILTSLVDSPEHFNFPCQPQRRRPEWKMLDLFFLHGLVYNIPQASSSCTLFLSFASCVANNCDSISRGKYLG